MKLPLLALPLLALPLAAAPAAAADSFPTQVSLLIGFPDENASGARGALVVPGTVLPVTPTAPAGLLEKDEEATARLVRVAEGLRKTLRLEAVRQWRFEPALLDGKPVAVYYNLTINFRLDDEKKE